MRLNVKKPVLGVDHRPVQEPETLRSYLVSALNNKSRTETEPTGAEDAAKRYQLSTKLYSKNDVDLTVSECGLLQDRIKALYADVPLILGRVCAMIEGEEIEVPAAEGDDSVVADNADPTSVAANDSKKPAAIQPQKN